MTNDYLTWMRKWLKARSLPRAVRNRRAQVYEIIKREWPAIAMGARIASDDWEKAARVADQLRERAKMEHPKVPHEWEQWVAAFAAMLDRGYRSGLWAITLPAFAMELARPRSLFSPGSVAMLRKARAIEQALLKSLPVDGNSRGVDSTAQILCSSILLGGLLSWKRLIRLTHVRAEHLRHDEDMMWADFPSDHDEKRDAPQASQTPGERTVVSRWFADPISALLLLRRVWESRTEPGVRLLDGIPLTRETAIRRIRSFLTGHGCPIDLAPRSLREMFECGAMRLLQYSMGVVVAYAKGQVQSASLTVEPWARARSGLALGHRNVPAQAVVAVSQGAPPAALASTKSSDAAIDARSDQMLGRLLRVIGKLSNRRHVRRKMLVKAIQSGVELGVNPQSALGCLLAWCGELIESRQLRLSSVHRYLTALAKKLAHNAGLLDLGTASEAELKALYSAVLRDTKRSQRAYVSSCIAQFHHYLMRTREAVDVDFADVEGFTCDETEVSANLLTPAEYEACTGLLTPYGNPGVTYGRRRWIAYLALVIGYRGGLRPSEICELRLEDLNFDSMPELAVCRGSRKSANAKRVIPLGLFLSRQEYTTLRRWWRQRRTESCGNMAAPLLAIDPNTSDLLSEDEIRAPVQEVMRRVTGDVTLTFKHLRHSFANWVFLMLVADEIPGSLVPGAKVLTHAAFSTRRRMRLRRYFFPQGNAAGGRHHPVRPALYQVAQLLGHSGPAVSLRHYIHIMDYLLGREVYEICPQLSVKQAAVLLDVSPARVYQICEGRLEDGLLHPGVLVAEAARRAGIGPEHFRSQMATHNTSKVHVASIDDPSAYACDVILRLAEAHAVSLRQGNKLASDLTDVLEKFSVNSGDLNLWHQAACMVSDRYRTRNQVLRHDLVSRIPRGWEERMEVAQLMDILMLAARTKRGAWAVWRNVGRYLRMTITRSSGGLANGTRSAAVFRTPHAARTYLRFLRDFGLSDGRIVLLHLRRKGGDAAKTLRDRRWWGRQLGFSADFIRPRDAEANRASGKHGWIAISVQAAGFVSGRSRRKAGPAKARRQSSRAFHCALHLFAIWGEMQRLIRRNVATRVPVSRDIDPSTEWVRF